MSGLGLDLLETAEHRVGVWKEMHLWEIKDKAGTCGGGGEGGGMVPLRNPIDSTLFTNTTQSERRLHLKHSLQSNERVHLSVRYERNDSWLRGEGLQTEGVTSVMILLSRLNASGRDRYLTSLYHDTEILAVEQSSQIC